MGKTFDVRWVNPVRYHRLSIIAQQRRYRETRRETSWATFAISSMNARLVGFETIVARRRLLH